MACRDWTGSGATRPPCQNIETANYRGRWSSYCVTQKHSRLDKYTEGWTPWKLLKLIKSNIHHCLGNLYVGSIGVYIRHWKKWNKTFYDFQCLMKRRIDFSSKKVVETYCCEFVQQTKTALLKRKTTLQCVTYILVLLAQRSRHYAVCKTTISHCTCTNYRKGDCTARNHSSSVLEIRNIYQNGSN